MPVKQETLVQAEIRKYLTVEGTVRLWRNNVGVTPNRAGGFIRYGLANGSGDLIGLVRGTGRFVSVEIKTPTGRIAPEQEAWRDTINGFGGIAVVLRSVDDAKEFVQRIKDGYYDHK